VEEESGNILLHSGIKNAFNIASKAVANLIIFPFLTAIIGLLLIKAAIKEGKSHFIEAITNSDSDRKDRRLKDKVKKLLHFMFASGLFGVGLAFLLLPHSKRTNILMISNSSGNTETPDAFTY